MGKQQWARMDVEMKKVCSVVVIFFFNDTATTEIYTLSLHDALPIFCMRSSFAYDKDIANHDYRFSS